MRILSNPLVNNCPTPVDRAHSGATVRGVGNSAGVKNLTFIALCPDGPNLKYPGVDTDELDPTTDVEPNDKDSREVRSDPDSNDQNSV